MVTSEITYMGDVPTFTNVITFHDIALQTYDNGASNITLMFTQHFIADWTELKVETETYADLTKMNLYYSNGYAVPFNTTFSLNFNYMVCLINQTASDLLGHPVFILPTSVTQTSLNFTVKGIGDMPYSLAGITLADNYTEVQGAVQVPNKTASAYFEPGWASGCNCFQGFTNLTYGVTKAVISDPTINVHHTSVPIGWGWGSSNNWVLPVAFVGGIASVAVVATVVVVRRRRRR
jgi:hypothetical protein